MKNKLKSITPKEVKMYYKKGLHKNQISSIISYIKSLSFLLIKSKNYGDK